jgi:PhoH-like ATPase
VKNYILDTNVLLHDPNSLLSFQDNNVLIPIEVIEEIDRFKRESSELGQNARTVSRALDALRTQGHLNEGVRLSNGGCLRIIFYNNKQNGQVIIGNNTVDSRIVALAQAIQKQNAKIKTIVVSKDINLRVKANALGLESEDYETDRIFITDLYTGMFELTVGADLVKCLPAERRMEVPGQKNISRTNTARSSTRQTPSGPR